MDDSDSLKSTSRIIGSGQPEAAIPVSFSGKSSQAYLDLAQLLEQMWTRYTYILYEDLLMQSYGKMN